jgi:hypothetical protein
MSIKLYTVGGNLATLYNNTTALSSVIRYDPNIILRYYTHNTAGSGAYYDGFSIRVPDSYIKSVYPDYSNMCYYSDTYYEKPKIDDLIKAEFIPSADLTVSGSYNDLVYNDLVFPYDTEYKTPGAYVIPKSAYSGDKSLYVYIWLPDINYAPDYDNEAGVDCTTLAVDSVGLDILKADVPNLTSLMFNQTYVSAIHNANIASGFITFGYGDVVTAGLPTMNFYDSNVHLDYGLADSNPTPIYNAINSTIDYVASARYVSGCDINLQRGAEPYYSGCISTAIDSRVNVGSDSYIEEAYNCAITSEQSYHGIANYASGCNITLLRDIIQPDVHQTYVNCNFSGMLKDARNVLVSSCNITGAADISTLKWTWVQNARMVKTYLHNTLDNTNWYFEDFPSRDPVQI